MKRNMANHPQVRLSPEASKLLHEVRKASESHNIYVFLDDAGCCDSSNAFVTSSSARLGSSSWVRVLKEKGVTIYGEKRFLRTAEGGTLVLKAGQCDATSDSMSLETRHGKRLYAGFETQP